MAEADWAMLFEKTTARPPLICCPLSSIHLASAAHSLEYIEKVVYQHRVACGQKGFSMPIHNSLIKLQIRMGTDILPHSCLNSNQPSTGSATYWKIMSSKSPFPAVKVLPLRSSNGDSCDYVNFTGLPHRSYPTAGLVLLEGN